MSDPGDRIPRRAWVGLVVLALYVLGAAGASSALVAIVQPTDDDAEFALSHLPILPVLIALALVFAWRSGWWRDVWTTPRAVGGRPRRWWMLSIPVLLLMLPIPGLIGVPWPERAPVLVLSLAIGTVMVGIGEELVVRGILRTSIRAHHGELVTAVSTSLLFGLAHTVGDVVHGIPIAIIAFQVAFLSMNGLLYYAAFRATGTLIVPIVLHALTDFSLYVQASGGYAATGDAVPDGGPFVVIVQVLLIVLSVVFLVSLAREDHRARVARRHAMVEHHANGAEVRG